MRVTSTKNIDGTFTISLAGCTFYESSVFADCLNEILGPIGNPRYLITRSGEHLGMEKIDFHAVPLKIGVKKKNAEIFKKYWNRYVGPTNLIYTRTDEGRSALIKARIRAFSDTFAEKVKRQDMWK